MSRRRMLLFAVIASLAVLLISVTVLKFMHTATRLTQVSRPPRSTNTVAYLPLGDSYTIGQSVAENDRWPNQLAARYKPGGKTLAVVANPAVTGYTTQDLIQRELPLVRKLQPDFVTVQIGVNDYVQGMSQQSFDKNLKYIIQFLQATMSRPHNILLVTIPDYAKTPTGARYGDPAAATAAIQQYNQIIIRAATQAGLPYADIFTVSQKVAQDPALLAADGLHPSGQEYGAWVAIIQQSLATANIPRLK